MFSVPDPMTVDPTPTDSVLDIDTLIVLAVSANPADGVKLTFTVPDDISAEYVPISITDTPVFKLPYSRTSTVVPS